jgi:uncharacterized 2Fe-2S/4Fe-4S cluster protein (DUF4445 family)
MARVTILPVNLEIEVKPGDTLMGAAQGLGFYWPTTCGGEAILSRPVRLACQATVLRDGTITVNKPGVRAAGEA